MIIWHKGSNPPTSKRFWLEITPGTLYIRARWWAVWDHIAAARHTRELRATGFHSEAIADLQSAGIGMN